MFLARLSGLLGKTRICLGLLNSNKNDVPVPEVQHDGFMKLFAVSMEM